MRKLGVYLLVAGFGSIVLNQFGYEFMLLSWIDSWGPTVGWAIKGGFIVLGAILLVLNSRAQSAAPAEEVESEPVDS